MSESDRSDEAPLVVRLRQAVVRSDLDLTNEAHRLVHLCREAADEIDAMRPHGASNEGDTPLDPVIQAWVDWMDDESLLDEVMRLASVISELRQALDQALTCTAIWCMCEAHELLRQTEIDEGPS
jgi:hypothetical protein